MKYLLTLLTLLYFLSGTAAASTEPQGKGRTLVYRFNITEEIAPAAWRQTQKAFREATAMKADVILIYMNTYGGLVDMADSIRTCILNSPIPVYVFIENNAASAGALISIACKKIYMKPGANIGAASVVNQSGELAPDKYQSYMRSKMRATAEVTGRDPRIAEAMVDGNMVVDSINKPGQVITFTTTEAIKYGYCDGEAETPEEALKLAGLENYEIVEIKLTTLDKIINTLINPAISGLLILLIIGGIYYELQSPGIGFALLVSVVAALLYFAPLYLEGLAANWEILVFIAGIILIGIEILAIPGFGVTGIGGIVLVVLGLAFSLIRNVDFDFSLAGAGAVSSAFLLVLASITAFIILALSFGGSILHSRALRPMIQTGTLEHATVADPALKGKDELTGTQGIAISDMRPFGRVRVNDIEFNATSLGEHIEKGAVVQVIRQDTSKLTVKRAV
jgi:membrane-bound serine protease (ClpP class)